MVPTVEEDEIRLSSSFKKFQSQEDSGTFLCYGFKLVFSEEKNEKK
ncbi:hypothetical protein SR187_2920 [Streptococcus ruminantium]|uniref:Uncharacterized protein n=1 Tax=Streptococcus ruminantium TaxID=1917441 RepID=A0A2Z5U2W5_9STRE|nr:hypothetical protein SR187_2920 [Streptococcus ruminantium]